MVLMKPSLAIAIITVTTACFLVSNAILVRGSCGWSILGHRQRQHQCSPNYYIAAFPSSFAFGLTLLPRKTRHTRGVSTLPLLATNNPQETVTPGRSEFSSLTINTNKTMEENTTNLWSIEECLEAWNNASNENSIRFVDATWFHKGNRTGRDEFEKGPRLPGSVLWDVYELSASGEFFPSLNPTNLDNIFPPEWFIGRALERTLKPEQEDATTAAATKTTLVVYGRKGTLFAPRIWYLLNKYCRPNLFNVKLLQGSMEDWIAAGGPFEDNPRSDRMILAKDLVDSFQKDERKEQKHPLVVSSARNRLVDKKFVLEILERRTQGSRTDSSELPSAIIDTRGMSFQNGHIPGSVHIPYASLSVDDDALTLKSREELKEVLKTAMGGSDDALRDLQNNPPLLTCGTAVSVCTLALVLDELGYPEPWIYDGSWNEWGKDPSTPKVNKKKDE